VHRWRIENFKYFQLQVDTTKLNAVTKYKDEKGRASAPAYAIGTIEAVL
jgi:hypothetical protein